MLKNKLILIYGSMCAGKTTVIDSLKKEFEGLIHLSPDNIKWFISDYSTQKYLQTNIINKLIYSMSRIALKEGLSVVIEGNIGLKSFRNKYKEHALQEGIDLVELNIEADFSDIKHRFEDRKLSRLEFNEKMSTKDINVVKSRFKQYHETKIDNIPTFNTSILSKEMLLEELIKLLKIGSKNDF